MYCRNCGRELKEGMQFCPRCGVEVKKTQPEIGNHSPIQKESKKKGIVFFIIALLCCVCILGGIFIGLKFVKEKQYNDSMAIGMQYMEKEQYEEAVKSFDQAIKYKKMNIEPYYNKANAYVKMGDVDQAGNTYDTVITVLLNNAQSQGTISDNDREICKEIIAFWGNAEGIDKAEKNEKIDDIVYNVSFYADEDTQEELYYEQKIYGYYGMASEHITGTYFSKTKKENNSSTANHTRYAVDDENQMGVVFSKNEDFDSDGKKETVIVYYEIDENENLNFVVSFDSTKTKNSFKYPIYECKSADYYYFIKDHYMVIICQEDKAGGFYDGMYYPVFNDTDDVDGRNISFCETIIVKDLNDQKRVLEYQREIYGNYTSTTSLKSGENEIVFSKGYTSYNWRSEVEVIQDEDVMIQKVISSLLEYGIDNISMDSISWANRKNALTLDTSNIENIKKVSVLNSEGTVNELDKYNIEVTGTFSIDVLDFNNAGNNVENDKEEIYIEKANVFQQLPSEFVFTSGAGGWETKINLNDDGTFEGQYYDSDMGDTGAGYSNGTVYICDFNGKFTTPLKVSDYIYSMNLESINLKKTADEIYYENDVRYVVSEPYGFDDGDEFLIYLPGCPLEDVKEDFLSWSYINTEIRTTIPSGMYGIYNKKGRQGFVGEDDNNIWGKNYRYTYNSSSSELQPSYYSASNLVFWPASGAATLSLEFDWKNDTQTEFSAEDTKGTGRYNISLDFNDDYSSVIITVTSEEKYSLELWGGTADGVLSAEYQIEK